VFVRKQGKAGWEKLEGEYEEVSITLHSGMQVDMCEQDDVFKVNALGAIPIQIRQLPH
jgi:hypothetical protein